MRSRPEAILRLLGEANMPASLLKIGHVALASLVVLHPLDTNSSSVFCQSDAPARLQKNDVCLDRRAPAIGHKSPDRSLPYALPLVEHGAAPARSDESLKPQAGAGEQNCGGRCINPHPGNFRTWNGQQNGCWLTVWRQWPEGCTHHQGFNTCTNRWDVDQYGNAKVNWTCCVH